MSKIAKPEPEVARKGTLFGQPGSAFDGNVLFGAKEANRADRSDSGSPKVEVKSGSGSGAVVPMRLIELEPPEFRLIKPAVVPIIVTPPPLLMLIGLAVVELPYTVRARYCEGAAPTGLL